jgi:sodium/bile acid cotransporter 7
MSSSSAGPSNRKKELDELVNGLTTKFPDVEHLPPRAVRDLQATGSPVILIDTRTKEEQEVSIIPGSLTIEEFESREKEFSKTKIVAYCTIGYRSSQYAGQLKARGFDASNLKGSILAWTHEQLPLVTKDKITGQETETKTIHVFGDSWKLQADGYEPVVFKYGMLSYAKSAITSKFSKLFK